MDTPSSLPTDVMSGLTSRLVFFGNDFPSDNLTELFRRLHRWSKDQKFHVLAWFLDKSVAVIREELNALLQPVPDEVSSVQNILALLEGWEAIRTTPVGGAIESALLCVLQIAMVIGSHEQFDQRYELAAGTTLSGLSIGLFSAAAVACSSSLSELAQNGPESVRVAFRMGIHVDHISQSLEARGLDSTAKSWAYVVTGVAADVVQEELDRFNQETSNSELTKVFISAADSNSVSVTGPPSRPLKAFHYSHILRYSKHLPLPVYNGLCHAAHLYTLQDTLSIVKGSDKVAHRSVRAPVLSAQSGKPFLAAQAGQLLEEIVTEILTGRIYLDNLTSGIIRELSVASSLQVEVRLLRTSLIALE